MIYSFVGDLTLNGWFIDFSYSINHKNGGFLSISQQPNMTNLTKSKEKKKNEPVNCWCLTLNGWFIDFSYSINYKNGGFLSISQQPNMINLTKRKEKKKNEPVNWFLDYLYYFLVIQIGLNLRMNMDLLI